MTAATVSHGKQQQQYIHSCKADLQNPGPDRGRWNEVIKLNVTSSFKHLNWSARMIAPSSKNIYVLCKISQSISFMYNS